MGNTKNEKENFHLASTPYVASSSLSLKCKKALQKDIKLKMPPKY